MQIEAVILTGHIIASTIRECWAVVVDGLTHAANKLMIELNFFSSLRDWYGQQNVDDPR